MGIAPKISKFLSVIFLIIIFVVIGITIIVVFYSVPMPYQHTPRDAISSMLKTIGVPGNGMTDKFQMKPNNTIYSTQFNDKTGLGSKSIMFFRGAFSNTQQIFTIDTDSNGNSYAAWNGTQPITARAKVLCGQTAKQAAEELQLLDNTKYEYDANALIKYCGNIQPCCAIVFDKP